MTKKNAAVVHGAGPDDVRAFLTSWSAGGYRPERFGDVVCGCGVRALNVLLDDDAGVVIRACPACEEEHPLGDSAEFIDDDTEPGQCQCPCGKDLFEVVIGLALYAADDDVASAAVRAVRWVSVGLRCIGCAQIACYGDWKNEHDDVDDYLRRL